MKIELLSQWMLEAEFRKWFIFEESRKLHATTATCLGESQQKNNFTNQYFVRKMGMTLIVMATGASLSNKLLDAGSDLHLGQDLPGTSLRYG